MPAKKRPLRTKKDAEGDPLAEGTLPVEDTTGPGAPDGHIKKKKTDWLNMTPEEEKAAADWLRENDLIYNKKAILYKETWRREQLWQQLSELLQKRYTVVELKRWFKSMRTVFGKITRMQSGSGRLELTERMEWIRDTFKFIRPHIARKKGVQPTSVS